MSFLEDLFNDPIGLNDIGTGIAAAGQLITGSERKQYGQDQQAALDFQARQLREQGGNAQAAAQRDAYFEERRARYAGSAALAAAAASGGGASDPTVINIIADIAAEGAYRQQVALYGGQSRAQQLELQAQAAQIEGSNRARAGERDQFGSILGAGTTMLKGFERDSSMYQRFGMGGPKATASGDGASNSWWLFE